MSAKELTKRSALTLPGKASSTALVLPDDLSFELWQETGSQLQHAERALMWWLGDWWAFGDAKYGERATQATDEYSYQALADAGWVARQFESSRRRESLSFSHHREVAALEAHEADLLLDKAEAEGWTRREIRQAARQAKAARIARAEATLPNAKYRVIYADPPWRYSNEQPAYHTEQADHYTLMSVEEIAAMPIIDIAADNSVLFLWVTSPILEESFSVVRSWGFEYKTSFVWDKVKHNMGHYNSVRHELLLIATRGACTPDAPKLFDSVVTQERGEHSVKPSIFYEIIETLYPHGKRIELFARNNREGWDAHGQEIRARAA